MCNCRSSVSSAAYYPYLARTNCCDPCYKPKAANCCFIPYRGYSYGYNRNPWLYGDYYYNGFRY